MKLENSAVIFKTLGDNSRLGIIRALLNKKMCVEDIAENLSLAESTVSFHLNKLESAGLVNREKDQYYTYYRLKPGILNHSLISLIDDSDTYIQKKDSDSEKKTIIDSFFRHGKLISVPRQNKKRIVILDFFAEQFEYGREYSEKEINSNIEKYYDDYCLIRR